jgi:hypothetical protein
VIFYWKSENIYHEINEKAGLDRVHKCNFFESSDKEMLEALKVFVAARL